VAAAAACIFAICLPRTDHRQLRRALVIRRTYGDLVVSTPGDGCLLDRFVGTCRPHLVYTPHSLRGCAGPLLPQLSFLHILLGDEQALEAEAQLYQRLLARDQSEARTVVDSFLKGKPLIELYDSVLIPALSLAEQDRHNGTIDTTHEEFLFLSINEMIAEFAEYQPVLSSPEDEGAARGPGLTAHFSGRILCLPANDQADEITAAMLAQLLEQRGYGALSFPHSTSPLDMLALLDPGPDDIICISALPPYAFAPARMICQQMRGRFPTIKLVAGVWGFKGDTEKAKARFERNQPDRLLTSLAQAVEQIEELVGRHRGGSAELQSETVYSQA